jgi:hypothetical protein
VSDPALKRTGPGLGVLSRPVSFLSGEKAASLFAPSALKTGEAANVLTPPILSSPALCTTVSETIPLKIFMLFSIPEIAFHIKVREENIIEGPYIADCGLAPGREEGGGGRCKKAKRMSILWRTVVLSAANFLRRLTFVSGFSFNMPIFN